MIGHCLLNVCTHTPTEVLFIQWHGRNSSNFLTQSKTYSIKSFDCLIVPHSVAGQVTRFSVWFANTFTKSTPQKLFIILKETSFILINLCSNSGLTFLLCPPFFGSNSILLTKWLLGYMHRAMVNQAMHAYNQTCQKHHIKHVFLKNEKYFLALNTVFDLYSQLCVSQWCGQLQRTFPVHLSPFCLQVLRYWQNCEFVHNLSACVTARLLALLHSVVNMPLYTSISPHLDESVCFNSKKLPKYDSGHRKKKNTESIWKMGNTAALFTCCRVAAVTCFFVLQNMF